MTGPMLVAVAVPAPLYRSFDYRVPAALIGHLIPGVRVRVPFGRRQVVGLVMSAPRGAANGDIRYKPVGAVLDAEPLLPPDLLALLQWAAAYYQHPVGEVVAAALPGPLRRGGAAQPRRPQWVRLTAAAPPAPPSRARAQGALLVALRGGPRPRSELSAAPLRRVLEQGWAESFFPPTPPAAAGEDPPPATAAQDAAVDTVLAGQGFAVTVLEGVTGSGKTEVYLRLAAAALARGRQVLVLVPEIGLTPQLMERFQRRFPGRVASFHSGMSEADRADVWLRARDQSLAVVVGTRSAVFLPLRALALVVVDEEHDVSLKQQESFRYHARDVAVWRARQIGAAVVLGSATPALETLHNVDAGRYRRAVLAQRIAAAPPPVVQVVDARGLPLRQGLTPPLRDAVRRHLAEDGQVLLFINRRGYAPALLCHDCGWVADCRRCDARMTLHRARGRLLCHHCGADAAVPTGCPACAANTLVPVGQGTERVEETLRADFPQARVERIDSDRMRRRGEWARLLDAIRAGSVDVLVGTQMLAKGHDFAGLSLVGIVSVDQALFSADFRALERMGQLVTQVSGRAGRGQRPGEVLLQTHQPQHPALRALLRDGYGAFARTLLEERRAAGWPPYAHLALLRAEAVQPQQAHAVLDRAAALLRGAPEVQVLGPVPAPMERRAGRYRAQLLLQSASRPALREALAAQIPRLAESPQARRARWSVDVDPVDLY